MGKILRTSKFTTGFEAVILLIGLALLGTGLWFFAPGLRVEASKQLSGLELSKDDLDNTTKTAMIDVPSTSVSTKVQNQPRIRIGGYAWNGQQGIYAANGGAFTTKGSLMEQYGVNLELVRQDWLSELSAGQLKFIEEYNSGKEFPESDKAYAFIMIMGDGAPFYISTRQKALDEKFGKGKYHLQVMGCVGGMSNGEDKVIGLPEWKTNPQTMRGALISVVVGDGDWVTLLNFCFANNLPVNPDFTTYDANAVNIYPSADDDYVNSAKELIASQTEGFTVTLKEVVDGKLTGKSVKRPITGCATWTPADKMVFDALTGYTDIASTADFKNQMPTTIIGVKEWAMKHPELTSNILKGALTASNQIKQYDEWRRRGAEAVASGFNLEDADYWYKMAKGQKGTKAGVTYNVGGTRYLNYADVLQYYGVTDGTNRYKAVYNQVSNYLVEMNPFGFNEAVDRVVPYEEAVNLLFLKSINDIDTGVVQKQDYTATKTTVMANGEWHINFATGSAEIQGSSDRDLDYIYNLLVQAEQTKVRVFGHTDNTGSDVINNKLSNDRANAVVNYLVSRGISRDRFQEVEGKGSTMPLAENSTTQGKAQNRRVQITFLQ